MKIIMTDRYKPQMRLVLESHDDVNLDAVNMASLSVGEEAKPSLDCFILSEEALRSLSRAALAVADDLRDKNSREKTRKGKIHDRTTSDL